MQSCYHWIIVIGTMIGIGGPKEPVTLTYCASLSMFHTFGICLLVVHIEEAVLIGDIELGKYWDVYHVGYWGLSFNLAVSVLSSVTS